ncbi:adenylate kinase isoenzyme 1 [Coccidioides immitis H538.4]|uniref:Adenylate kinase n=3 Tax=Coccidioides immitis TaxID=5501 RepID=A0A0J8QVJ9_COCIT|nr:adenylate kinase isoenzyme 1 [Coccidioides immitis RMSCC 2394]KMU75338.1 adenylate kinase [Coccidioides immitis RMSCC 3703]KMU88494.1 adenylate kinase isoenzyme 1 [Coccidioides immitis H538.4]
MNKGEDCSPGACFSGGMVGRAMMPEGRPQVIKFNQASANIIFILGGTGAGKGTQCAKLATDPPVVHLCVGDLVRAERERCSPGAGQLIEKCMREGTVVPLELVIGLLKAAVVGHVEAGQMNILCGQLPTGYAASSGLRSAGAYNPIFVPWQTLRLTSVGRLGPAEQPSSLNVRRRHCYAVFSSGERLQAEWMTMRSPFGKG